MLPAFLANVRVETATVAPVLAGATARGVLWQAAPGCFLLDVPEVARYRVATGRTITMHPGPRANATDVTRFLRMAPLAALLFQRGTLAFHAAAAATPRGAVLLAGDSGVGKSTLLSALLRRGWNLLSDDLAVVDLDESGRPVVFPTFPDITLSPRAAEKLGMTPDTGSCPGNDLARRVTIASFHPVACAPVPLRAIYWLSVHPQNGIDVSDVEGAERFGALGLLGYNSHIAAALLNRAAYFRLATIIAQSVPVRRLRRPRGRWSVDELAGIVEDRWN